MMRLLRLVALAAATAAAATTTATTTATATTTTTATTTAEPGGGEGTFWHLTDVHLDRTYEACAGGEGAPRLGSYSCDSPAALVADALGAMAAVAPRPDFLVYTGDDPPHAKWSEMTRGWVYSAMANVTRWTRQAFPAPVPVFPALGNHESYPHDQVAPGSPMLAYAASLWGEAFGLPEQALRTVRAGGYYSAPVPGRPALRVVALNTVLWYTDNNATAGEADPAGQLAWLDAELGAAGARGDRVLLLSHVPPGVDERSGEPHLRARFNAAYVALLRRHAGALAVQLAGHEHSDSFRVGGPLLAPSLTPWKNHWDPRSLPNNPGVRLFSYDRGTGRPSGYTQYYLDLAEARPAWQVEYNATDAFGGLAPAPDADLARLELLERDDEAFDRYVRANLVGYPQGGACRGACRARHLCAIRHLDLDAYAACARGQGRR